MKITSIEKYMIAAIAVFALGLAVSLMYLRSSAIKIQERGLKSIVEEIWVGDSATKD